MRKYLIKTVQNDIVVCDRCGRELGGGSQETQEAFAVRFRAGYGSVFEDGNLVEGDFCQHCIQKAFGDDLRITPANPTNPAEVFARLPVSRRDSFAAYLRSSLQGLSSLVEALDRIEETDRECERRMKNTAGENGDNHASI